MQSYILSYPRNNSEGLRSLWISSWDWGVRYFLRARHPITGLKISEKKHLTNKQNKQSEKKPNLNEPRGEKSDRRKLDRQTRNAIFGATASLPSRGGDVVVCGFDRNQPSLPSPFYSVLVSISVFMSLSTVFQSINSPNNSPFSRSVLPVFFLPY